MDDKTSVFLQFSTGKFDLLANYRIKIIDINIRCYHWCVCI